MAKEHQSLTNKIYSITSTRGEKMVTKRPMNAQGVRKFVANLYENENWKKNSLNKPFEQVLDCLAEYRFLITIEK